MKQTKQARVLELHAKGLKPKDIATKGKCALTYVYKIISDNKVKAQNNKADAQHKVYFMTSKKSVVDNVNHPAHYKAGGIETIDFIEAKGLDYHLGNVVKYVSRSNLKGNKLEDLQKAQWYLNRAISKLSK